MTKCVSVDRDTWVANLVRHIVALCCSTTLAGCSLFAPNGDPPAMRLPTHYGAAPIDATSVVASGVAQRFQARKVPTSDWWKLYCSSSLNSLVDEGVRQSPTLGAIEKNLMAAREQLRAQIGSTMLPEIDAGSQTTRARSLPPIPQLEAENSPYNTFAGQLQASYTVDVFGAARFANLALAKRVDASAWQLEAARQALALNIVTAVITIGDLHERIDTTERLVALSRQQAVEAAERHHLGAISHDAVLRAQQNLATLEANVPVLRQQLQTTRHALAVILGRTPDQAPADIPLSDLHLPEDVPVLVPSSLLLFRPDIQAADATLKASAESVGAATAQMFPQISLSASMGKAGYSWPALLSGVGAVWSVGASLTQPLFHGGALYAQREAAMAHYDAAVENYRATVLTAFQDVADILTSLDADASQLRAWNNVTAAALVSRNEAMERARLGALPLSAARSTDEEYQSARLNEIRSSAGRLADTARLFHAMGALAMNTRTEHEEPNHKEVVFDDNAKYPMRKDFDVRR
ncbi:RND transporter [Burkholderia sp. Bp8989]|nr:RND transporter [Burkholderia sp. Bp8995]RQS48458.1 RND transporter [Burkholderia sp. Bp8989]